MLAATAGVWSYLAWIKASALACVKSGADLQPLRNIPAPRNANAPKTTIFTAFFTFPPYTAQKVSKLARIAIVLLLSSEVNGVESDLAHSCQFFALEAQIPLRKTEKWRKLTSSCPLGSGGGPPHNPAQQQLQKPLFVRFQADLSIGGPIHRPGKALVVYFKAHGRSRAEVGTQGIGDGHRVKERGRGRMTVRAGHPLVVEQGQLVGERGAVGKNRLPGRRLEVDLRRVEGHHEDRHAAGQQRSGACRVAVDVPLGVGRPPRPGFAVVVAPVDAAAHQHHPLELAEGGRVALDGRLNVEQRADGDERDLARMGANLAQQELDRIGVFPLRLLAGVGSLGEDIRSEERSVGKE